MNLRSMQPEDLIISSCLPAYEQYIEILFGQLARLNAKVFLLDKILHFPFDVFPPPPGAFWRLTEYALFEAAVMIIWRVFIGSKDDGVTLRQLKNRLLREYLMQEYRGPFKDALRDAGFERSLKRVVPKLENVRNAYIAHFDLEKHVNPTAEDVRLRTLEISELKKCVSVLNSFFLLLCFGKPKYALVPGYYFDGCLLPDRATSSSDVGGPSDIELLLDGLARGNKDLNLPEDSKLWPAQRRTLSSRELEVINEYREKFGMPPA